jgi:hypothetical protein
MNPEERRHVTVHQFVGTASGMLNIILMLIVLTGGMKAFYELQATVIIINTTLTDLRTTIQQFDSRLRLVESRQVK